MSFLFNMRQFIPSHLMNDVKNDILKHVITHIKAGNPFVALKMQTVSRDIVVDIDFGGCGVFPPDFKTHS